jgi:lipopolysaccharide export LptBFGC system permease protein LptF
MRSEEPVAASVTASCPGHLSGYFRPVTGSGYQTTGSIGAGIVIGFSYWLVYAFAMSLGRAGTLPPLLAAWTANIVFGIASYLMYRRVRT